MAKKSKSKSKGKSKGTPESAGGNKTRLSGFGKKGK